MNIVVLSALAFIFSQWEASLSNIPLEVKGNGDRLKIVSTSTTLLEEGLKRESITFIREKDGISFSLKNPVKRKSKVDPTKLETSFLINYKKEPFQKLKTQKLGPKELETFVYKHIEKKNYSRGIERASTTLLEKTGDCTEHAILLAALLRKNSIPARVVLGIAISKKMGGAYMHAWTQYHDSKSATWKHLDATKIPVKESHYIPLHIIENESMSFARGFLKPLSTPISMLILY